MKKVLSILLALFIAGSTLFANGQQGDSTTADPVEFRIGNYTEPESLDPHLITGQPEHRINLALFENLVSVNPEDASALPGVAESWEVSNGGKTYTFKIRKDLVWSDGVAITAQTVVDSWLRMLAPETASRYAYFPEMFIEGATAYHSGEAGPESVQVRALDELTFQMDLLGPLPYVLDALSHYSFGIVPMHAIEEFGNEWTHPENFVGNGPYVLETWVPQDKLTVVPNPLYWDADKVNLDRVIFYPIDDNNTTHNMYMNGELDWNTVVPVDQIEQVQLRDDCNIAPELSVYYYVFHMEKEPFNNPLVRKALSMAVNRDDLVNKVAKGGQLTAYSMVPDMAGYDAIRSNNEDVAEAQRLLAEAGYPGGEGFPSFDVLYNTAENHKKIAEYIQHEWKEKLGIEVSLKNEEWKTYLLSRNVGDFKVARAGWGGDYQDPNTFLDLFITGGGNNGGKYSNLEYDALLAKAASMEAGPARMAVLAEAENILVVEDQAIMPIYYDTSRNMLETSKWGGFYPNIMDWHPVKDIFLK